MHFPLVHKGFCALIGVHSALYGFEKLRARGVVFLSQLDELPADGFVVGLELVILSAEGLR